MTACAFCGLDADAPVLAQFEFFIPVKPKSLNAHAVNAGASRWAYKRDRNMWQWHVKEARLRVGIPGAHGRRRVTLTRHMSNREREWDADNWSGGAKPIA